MVLVYKGLAEDSLEARATFLERLVFDALQEILKVNINEEPCDEKELELLRVLIAEVDFKRPNLNADNYETWNSICFSTTKVKTRVLKAVRDQSDDLDELRGFAISETEDNVLLYKGIDVEWIRSLIGFFLLINQRPIDEVAVRSICGNIIDGVKEIDGNFINRQFSSKYESGLRSDLIKQFGKFSRKFKDSTIFLPAMRNLARLTLERLELEGEGFTLEPDVPDKSRDEKLEIATASLNKACAKYGLKREDLPSAKRLINAFNAGDDSDEMDELLTVIFNLFGIPQLVQDNDTFHLEVLETLKNEVEAYESSDESADIAEAIFWEDFLFGIDYEFKSAA